MSIFKESFRQFVKQQMAIREAIISKGNNGDSRFDAAVVDLSKIGGKKAQSIDPGAFFTNTVNRQCVIRMSSGCDLTEFGSVEFAEGGFYEKSKHIQGSGLARRYILQGGTLAVDRHTIEKSDISETTETTATIDGKVDRIFKDTTRTRNEKYAYKLGNRSGFRGISPNDFGTAWGDPTIRANPGEDFGSVPMPGIKSANIRTKSAYGSLREAKVEFVCHNLRQLEVLELLYMRPGIPILLEWGWTPYINNKGKRTLDFPFIGEWWISEGSMDSINRQIIQQKVKTGGNYDALAGMCKNFSYKARPDGGFDCTTEIIAQGEIIEALKGEQLVIPTNMADGNIITKARATGTFSLSDATAKAADFMEIGLNDFINFGISVDRSTNDDGEERWTITIAAAQTIRFNAETFNFWDSAFDVYGKATALKTLSEGKLLPPSPVPHMSYYFGMNELTEEQLSDTFEGDNRDELIKNGLRTMILTPHSYFPLGDEEGFQIRETYIRWDAFVNFINSYVINRDGNGTPVVTFSTNTVINEDTNPRVEPLLMSRINIQGIPTGDGMVGTAKTVHVKPDGLLNNFYASFPVNAVLNSSVDPGICLFPEQLTFSKNGNFSSLLYAGSVALGFGVGAVLSGGVMAGAGAVAGAELYQRWAKQTVMTSGDRNIRNIGHIYLNCQRMLKIYREQRYDNEGELNDDFNLYDFIKKVWDDVSAASGNKYNFIIHNDLERPSVLRIIDANFQKDAELTKEKIHELKIQSNDTICRDFSYNSVIPNELSATIGVAMQNPDSIQDIDGATFAAMSRGIKSRFHVPTKREISEPTDDEKKKAKENYSAMCAETGGLFSDLASFQGRLMSGDLQKIDSDTGEPEAQEEISKAQTTLKAFFNRINKLQTLHGRDGIYSNGVKYYKGYPKKVFNAPPVSSVIPLKFNAKLDGISGITIGNVFSVDPTRLPKAYRGNDIAFVCMGEQQAVTAGQDWTTDIHGQLVLLPPTGNAGGDGSGTAGGDGASNIGQDLDNINDSAIFGDNFDGDSQEVFVADSDEEQVDDDAGERDEPVEGSKKDELDKQDQCPEGMYYDEEFGGCLSGDPDLINSFKENAIEGELEGVDTYVKDNYEKWFIRCYKIKQYAKYVEVENRRAFDHGWETVTDPNNIIVEKMHLWATLVSQEVIYLSRILNNGILNTSISRKTIHERFVKYGRENDERASWKGFSLNEGGAVYAGGDNVTLINFENLVEISDSVSSDRHSIAGKGHGYYGDYGHIKVLVSYAGDVRGAGNFMDSGFDAHKIDEDYLDGTKDVRNLYTFTGKIQFGGAVYNCRTISTSTPNYQAYLESANHLVKGIKLDPTISDKIEKGDPTGKSKAIINATLKQITGQ